MQIEQVTKVDQIKEGDLLLISDGNEITHAKAQKVKVTDHDGTEVIFDKRKNKYFNVGMYLNGESWVKDVCIVRNQSDQSKNHDKLLEVKKAVEKYYLALDRREHGGIAQDRAFNEIQQALGMHWQQGEALKESKAEEPIKHYYR